MDLVTLLKIKFNRFFFFNYLKPYGVVQYLIFIRVLSEYKLCLTHISLPTRIPALYNTSAVNIPVPTWWRALLDEICKQ